MTTTTPTDTVKPQQTGLEQLSKSFEPAAIEAQWGPEWEKRSYATAGYRGTSEARDDADSFAIQLPPPNVTGTLHMGHAFNQTIMDSLTRYHRMRGFNTVWVPGTDHAGIATQIVVERQLAGEGISRHDMGPTPEEARKNFVARVWEWKHQSGGTITNQMRRMGDSVDWAREYFTMDDKLSTVVIETFVRLYEQGLIYRGKRLVNWDPVLMSAVSDLEVESTESDGKMHYICYPFADGPQLIDGVEQRGMTIATTRPETMMADGALAVHPEDPRYQHLIGKLVDLPLCDRQIPIIADDFVDREFGSGCVKITGAHAARRPAPQPTADHDLHARRQSQRKRPGALPRPRSLRRTQSATQRFGSTGFSDRDQAAQTHAPYLRPNRPSGRAHADRPMVRGHDPRRRQRPHG